MYYVQLLHLVGDIAILYDFHKLSLVLRPRRTIHAWIHPMSITWMFYMTDSRTSDEKGMRLCPNNLWLKQQINQVCKQSCNQATPHTSSITSSGRPNNVRFVEDQLTWCFGINQRPMYIRWTERATLRGCIIVPQYKNTTVICYLQIYRRASYYTPIRLAG